MDENKRSMKEQREEATQNGCMLAFLSPAIAIGCWLVLELPFLPVLLGCFVLGVLMYITSGKRFDNEHKEEIAAEKAAAKSAEARRFQIMEEDEYIAFYEACKQEGITSLSSENNKEKVRLIAQREGFAPSEAIEAFEKGRTILKERHLAQKTAEQNEQERVQNVYAGTHGREKRIAWCREEIAAARRRLAENQAVLDGIYAMEDAMYQKEHDWAIHGGIASGIAGPVAGAVTAVNIQQKNAAIRQQNRDMMHMTSMIAANSGAGQNVGFYSDLIKRREQEIEEIRIKLVSKLSTSAVFSKIDVSEPTVTITETGAFRVKVSAKVSTRLDTYKNAVVDGTLKAVIYEDSKVVGEAYIPLPKEGLSGRSRKLEAVCTKKGTRNKNYRVEITPHKLWIMEA